MSVPVESVSWTRVVPFPCNARLTGTAAEEKRVMVTLVKLALGWFLALFSLLKCSQHQFCTMFRGFSERIWMSLHPNVMWLSAFGVNAFWGCL